MTDITIRPMKSDETDKIASLIAEGYYGDIFFKWVVGRDEDRLKVVTDYYKVYLGAKGSVVHVAQDPCKGIIGATVWLPHDVDVSIYDDIDKTAGIYANRFRAVADNSHYSEPPMTPFYQLVAVVVNKEAQGMGLGAKLLKHNLDKFDELGIPTYLEASTPYHGGGVYGKFGYQPVGELMVFTSEAVLYPLWRPARKKLKISFGGYKWRALAVCDDKMLLLSEKIITPAVYHDAFESITWSDTTLRKYLNDSFYNNFEPHEKAQILESELINSPNPWMHTDGGENTIDKIFLLSAEEVAKYLGDSGQLKNPSNIFFIDDHFNDERKATLIDGSPSRWFLRTPGSSADFVSVVTVEGKISITGDFVNRSSTELFNVGIRPAMWVKRDVI